MKRWLKRSAIVVTAVLAFAGIYYAANYNLSRHNFAVVEEGKIYRSGQPDDDMLNEMVEKYKLETIISLRGGPPRFEKKFAAEHGIKVISFDLDPHKAPTDEEIKEILAVMDDPANHPALVHCREGADRTGLLCAIRRVIHDGWSLESAEKELSFHRNIPLFTPMPRRKLREYTRERGVWDKEFGGLKDGTDSFRAAADKEVITPEGQTNLAGFFPKRLSVGVHDDLYARCLVVETPTGGRLAIVALDLLGFLRYDVLKVREELRQRKILDPLSLVVVSTHQHSGPDPIGVWGRSIPMMPNFAGSGRDEQYLAGVRTKIVALVERTITKLEKAEFSIVETSGAGYSRNLRIPEQLDTSMKALVVQGERGRIATLVNFGVHPEAYRRNNQLLTADFPGVLVQKVEKEFGGTAIFINGLLGAMVSVVTGDLGIENPTEEQRAEGVGDGLSRRLTDDEATTRPLDFSGGYLRLRRKTVKTPLENFYFQEGMKLGMIPHNQDILTDSREVITEVGIIDLGNVRILLVPGEMQPGLGLRIKEMAKADMIFGLANDEIGYIIPTEDFYKTAWNAKKGRMGDVYEYERTMSLGIETGDRIYRAFRELLEK